MGRSRRSQNISTVRNLQNIISSNKSIIDITFCNKAIPLIWEMQKLTFHINHLFSKLKLQNLFEFMGTF